MLIFMNKTLSGDLRELKNKGKVQLGNLKSGRGRLQERLHWPLFLDKQVFFLKFYYNSQYSTSLLLSVVFHWGHLNGE